VDFRYDTTVLALEREGDRIGGVRVRGPEGETRLEADAVVVALGSYTPHLLKPLGLRIPVYPAKGYSITAKVVDPSSAPVVSLTDDGHKLVFSRLGDELRVAGTAELNGWDTAINHVRCDAIVKRTRELFPDALDYAGARFWAGLRPATPGNVPIIGRTRFSNLFLNTGHGTLGWTLSCGSGRAIADIVSGRTPEVALRPTGV
jgi:D-amino-acid dehydrogenase